MPSCVEGPEIFHPFSARRNIQDVWSLGLCVERNTKGSLLHTKKELGNGMWLWAKSSQGMRKSGSLKETGKIGAEQTGVLDGQGKNLKKTFAKQLDVSITHRGG